MIIFLVLKEKIVVYVEIEFSTRVRAPAPTWPLSSFIFVSCFNADLYCVSKTNTIRAIVACLPAWWRFAQCLRRYRDTREMFPHLVNAFKYSTTFYVVTFTCLYYEYKGKLNFQLFNLTSLLPS